MLNISVNENHQSNLSLSSLYNVIPINFDENIKIIPINIVIGKVFIRIGFKNSLADCRFLFGQNSAICMEEVLINAIIGINKKDKNSEITP